MDIVVNVTADVFRYPNLRNHDVSEIEIGPRLQAELGNGMTCSDGLVITS